jgi:penicillin-binding protein 2
MYKQRLHIVISLCIAVIAVCLLRLIFLQVLHARDYRDRISKMRTLAPVQLPTVRGRILDRTDNVLARDKAVFYLHVKYDLLQLCDERVWEGKILSESGKDKTQDQVGKQLREKYSKDISNLEKVIKKSSEIGALRREEVESRIRMINNRVWNRRKFDAWSRNCPESPLKIEYKGKYVPLRKAMAEFDELFPNESKRLKLVMKEKPVDMYKSYPLIRLASNNQLVAAQLEFFDISAVEIYPEAERIYPYESSACQIIGWVGPAQEKEKDLFIEDNYSRYLEGEVIGKDGVERVCEVILRGRRGEVTYNKDFMLVNRKATQFGRDVRLSLDIELQQRIENYLTDQKSNPQFASGSTAAVVLEVATGDILAMVSTPIYDLNSTRQNYDKIIAAPGAPMKNKCLEEHYPPGSSIKPLILIAGLQEGNIKTTEIINCPYENQKTKHSFPNCLLFRKNSCHDWRWENEGGNIARNAIRGSCNVYFSRLANRLNPKVFQKWLYSFGYGRKILLEPVIEQGLIEKVQVDRIQLKMHEAAGQISSVRPSRTVEGIEDIPVLYQQERRNFGIGQGNLRTTVLQAANAAAAIARGGIFKKPRLFLSDFDIYNSYQEDLNISPKNLAVVRDGMKAVVYEVGGTAYNAFRNNGLSRRDITVYGKTGSTQAPNNAWFMCFAEDSSGRAVVVTLMVEGGESGGQDAAPLGRNIIRFCNEAGYVGRMPALQEKMLNSGEDM